MNPFNSPPGGGGLDAYLEMVAGGAPGDHFLELRFPVGGQQFANEFHRVDARDAMKAAILRRARRTDVYVGCAPRTSRNGTKTAIDDVWVLWVECDGEESARRLHRFRPRPALIIASGSGPNCHGYWPLTPSMPALDAEVANYRLAHALAADLACFDASRILRPPGTWNYKHEPPRPVAVVHSEQKAFEPEQVLANVPRVDTTSIERRWVASTRGTRRDPLLAIPPAVYVKALLGVEPGRNRKVHCPFHDDARPSLHVYPTGDRGWCCFACRRGGTIYDLAAAVWGVGTRGAEFVRLRQRLLERFEPELAATRQRAARELAR